MGMFEKFEMMAYFRQFRETVYSKLRIRLRTELREKPP